MHIAMTMRLHVGAGHPSSESLVRFSLRVVLPVAAVISKSAVKPDESSAVRAGQMLIPQETL